MKKLLSLILVTVFAISFLTSCASSDYAESDGYSANINGNVDMYSDKSSSSLSVENSELAKNTDSRKIIESVTVSAETKDFDTLSEKLESEISLLEGYVETSTLYGNSTYIDDNRTLEMTVRIPAEKSSEFVDFLEENCNVTEKSTTTDDVTLTYVDTESRISALESEKEALEELLKKSEKVEDIIAVRESLTDVIYEIESYKSTLRTYDNLVSYSTVTLSVYEVEKTTAVGKLSVWQEITSNLKNNFEAVWNGIVTIFVFFVSALPFILVIAVIAVIITVTLKISLNKKPKKTKKNAENIEKILDKSEKEE